MSDAPLQLAVIVGSTREGRLGSTVAEWLVTRARQRDEVALDVIDLVDVDLPMVYPQEPEPAAQAYIERIDWADAFVVITPEYNHGYPASLKQAIDLPRDQWRRKPVAFVSYGGAAGGLRAVEQLRQVFAELHAVTIRDSVSFRMAWDRFDESGEPHEPIRCNADAETMLDELAWWATALRTARTADPGCRRPSSRRMPLSSASSRSGHPAASIPNVQREPDTTAPAVVHFSFPRPGAVLDSWRQALGQSDDGARLRSDAPTPCVATHGTELTSHSKSGGLPLHQRDGARWKGRAARSESDVCSAPQ